MKLAPAYDRQRLGLRPIKITQLEPLTEAQVVERPVSVEEILFVSRSLNLQPFATPPQQEVVPKGNTGEDFATKRVTLADFSKNFTIGTGFASGSLGLIPLAKYTTEAQLAARLTDFGFAPDASSQMSSSALSFARSNLGQLCCVFLAGSAVTMGTIEALKPDWAWKRKIIFSGIGGVVLVTIAVVLIYLGVWGRSAQQDRNVAPTPVKADSKPANP